MGVRLVAGVNDLLTTHPELAAEWHPTKNGVLSSTEVMAGTSQKIWWLCVNGHEWEAKGYSRSSLKRGCPYCAGQRVIEGMNDLESQYPQVAEQWHPERNLPVFPNEVIAGTHKKFWWVCELGHEWQSPPVSRINGVGCPFCAGKAVLPGFNDLATTDAVLAGEWHPTKNGTAGPEGVIRGSHKKAWWVCSRGHDWEATIGSRTIGRGCPICSGRQILPGFNDLVTTSPGLAAEWHQDKNLPLAPRDVSRGSSKSVWWNGPCGHEWVASVSDRSVSNAGCPYCAGQSTLPGFNDLATTHPELLAEWHPSKNGNLDPSQIIAGTTRRIWWICPEGHEWQAKGNNRVTKTGCPSCATVGFDPNKPAAIYFISHQLFQARKIGITNVGTTRLADFARNGWKILKVMEHPEGSRVAVIESALLGWLRIDLEMPPFLGKAEMRQTRGWTETFSMDGPSDAEIIVRIEAEFAKLEQAN